MAQEYFGMSYYGTRFFKLPYTDSSTVPATASPENEITSVISCESGGFTKENDKKRTVNGNGWEIVIPLGNSADDITFECLREGTGGVYNGTAGNTTYTNIKNWFMEATQNGGAASPAVIIEVVPRGGTGNQAYEGTCYYVVPANWSPATKDTESGQTYSFTVSPFGPQVPVSVTYTPASGDTPESWAFAKATGSN